MGVVLHKAADCAADEVQIGVHRAVRSLQGTRNFVDRPPAPHREVERHRCAQHDRRKNQQKRLVAQCVQLLHGLLLRQDQQVAQAQHIAARKVQHQVAAAAPRALPGQPFAWQVFRQAKVIVGVKAGFGTVVIQHKQRISVIVFQKGKPVLQPVRLNAEKHRCDLAAHQAAAGDAVIKILPAHGAEIRRLVFIGTALLPDGGVIAPLLQLAAEKAWRVDGMVINHTVQPV